MQYNTIQYNTSTIQLQINTVQYNTIRCNAMHWNANNTTHHITMQYDTIRCKYNKNSLQSPTIFVGRLWMCWEQCHSHSCESYRLHLFLIFCIDDLLVSWVLLWCLWVPIGRLWLALVVSWVTAGVLVGFSCMIPGWHLGRRFCFIHFSETMGWSKNTCVFYYNLRTHINVLVYHVGLVSEVL